MFIRLKLTTPPLPTYHHPLRPTLTQCMLPHVTVIFYLTIFTNIDRLKSLYRVQALFLSLTQDYLFMLAAPSGHYKLY